MAKRSWLGTSVFSMAYDRLFKEYEAGHRIVVATSGGKDSTVITELARMAARDAGRPFVECCTRDEEIMLPGTFEYLERFAALPDVNFHWYVAHMPIVNAFNRESPLWFTFDQTMEPKDWVRTPPDWHEVITEKHQRHMVNAKRFPVGPGTVGDDGVVGFEGQRLYSVTGIRTAESPMRTLAIASSGRAMGWDKAHITGRDSQTGYHGLRPIYDWEDGDVWKFIADFKLDYNRAYDVMLRMGVPRRNLRIAPPTMRAASMKQLTIVAGAWPKWFDKVCKRVPGIRTAVQYGARAMTPERRLGESWQDVYSRCVLGDGNPEWIRKRGQTFIDLKLAYHAKHATGDWPDGASCPGCGDRVTSWREATLVMYMGDPYSLVQKTVHEMQPEDFRPGAGTWT
jgi:predicted phosphoadenosine phosphosulfate sulfurtransferase